ncbi:tetratricopeptide repeat protein [Streptomyces sp. TRM76323]|uniref:Tetratricopeptide repeat protein n=1 Tax=Streptomyces tamarix TaxID=3078565 RepID=A0ABU3QK88_9ACTN|nr:tetratricopeptide repeat protein [Streptomyces tamarix]MDT9682807.1 tetratricopeptide repeat protein [Streptomyces tamarix]
MSGNRVVRVAAAGGWAAGYEIAPRLVLTAAHAVAAVGSPVAVSRAGEFTDHPGHVVWRGTPEDPAGNDRSGTDAALVRVSAEDWEPAPPGRTLWGRIVGDGESVLWRATGFPHSEERCRESEQAEGKISPLSGLVGGMYVLDCTTFRDRGPDDSSWRGMSGAAVLCGDFVVGVVVRDVPDRVPARLEAERAVTLLRDGTFLAALERYGAPGPHVPQPVEYAALADPDHHAGTRHAPRSAVELLHPGRAIVPFHGREEELSALAAWAERADGEVAVVHAPGGRGKTRLVVELSRRLGAKWSFLWLRPGERMDARTRAPGLPLMVVVDGADGRVEETRSVLEFASRYREAPVKAVLLARSAGGWLEEVAGDSLHRGSVLSTALVRELPELPPAGPDDHLAAARALAAGLAALPGSGKRRWKKLAKRIPQPAPHSASGSPLTLHMTALVHLLDAAQGVAATTGDASAVEKRLLEHERAHWLGTARAHRLCPPLLWGVLEDAVAAVVALGPHGRHETAAVLGRVLGDGTAAGARAVHAWIRTALPTDGDAVGHLHPDRLAERLVGERFRDHPDLVDALLPTATPAQATRFLTLVTRASVRHAGPGTGELTDWCLRHPAVLGPAAVALAPRLEEPAPLLSALRALVDRPGAELGELEELAAAVPPSTHLLAPWALRLHRRIVDVHRLRAAADPAARPGLAVALRELSKRLSSMGEREESLRAVEEAHGLWREIPADHPRHRAERGACRVNASIFLTAAERRREAYQAAVEGADLLRAALRPDDPASRVDLVKALDTLMLAAGALGDHDTAWRVCEESGELCEAVWRDDPTAHTPLLVNHLNNRAIVAMGSGRRDVALAAVRRAVEMQRRLAADAPDAHLPGLALVLATASSAAQLAGLPREALEKIRESVTIRRRLAKARPRAYLADLASALNSLAIDLDNLGHRAEALDAAEESVRLYRELADEQPHVHTPGLALALNTLALKRQANGYRRRAHRVAQQSVHGYRELAEREPGGFRGHLAMSLATLAGTLKSEDGGPDTARAADCLREAVGILRDLFRTAPGAHLPDLANCLNNLAGAYVLLGDPRKALETVQEAMELNGAAEGDLPAAFAEPMLRNWLTAFRCHSDLGDFEGARHAGEEALARLRTLSVEAPSRYETDLWAVLSGSAALLWFSGEREESVRRSREALDIKDRWVGRDPDRHRAEQAEALEAYARQLWLLGRTAEASAAADEARAHRRADHLRRGDDTTRLALARADALLAELLEARGRWPDALAPAQDALAVLRAHHASNPPGLRADLSGVLVRQAGLLWRAGDLPGALSAVEEAVAVARTGVEPPPADFAAGSALLHRALLRSEAAASDTARAGASLSLLAEAVGFCEALPEDPSAELLLAGALTAFGTYAVTVPGREAEGVVANGRAVDVLRRHVDAFPFLASALADSLAEQARGFAVTGRAREAVEAADDAVRRARLLASQDPHAHREVLANALAASARSRLAADGPSAAARADSTEAVALFRALAREQPLAVARRAVEAQEVHDRLHA